MGAVYTRLSIESAAGRVGTGGTIELTSSTCRACLTGLTASQSAQSSGTESVDTSPRIGIAMCQEGDVEKHQYGEGIRGRSCSHRDRLGKVGF